MSKYIRVTYEVKKYIKLHRKQKYNDREQQKNLR